MFALFTEPFLGNWPGERPTGSCCARPGPAAWVVKDGGMDLGLASMFDPVNLPVLRQTVIIEAAAAAGVVVIEITHRRWRRARRSARLRQDAGAG
jgi:homospermidine synthase